jgi:hypothetical protein
MRKSFLMIVLSVACISLFFGCSDKGENVISGNGVITFTNLEGGCWGITLDSGKDYGISLLPEQFRQEGLRVRISAIMEESTAGFCQVRDGIIDILEIKII